jgi:glycosyltransferase involved in cell wall biosynthesis
MQIVQVAPLWFAIGARGPGGIETFLTALIEALRRAGADVTLIAAAGSEVPCRVVPAVERGLFDAMQDGAAWDQVPYEQHALRLARELGADADAVHCHLGPPGFALGDGPVLHTIHSLVGPDLAWFAARYPATWLSTVSEHHAAPLRAAGVARLRVIPNGLPFEIFQVGGGGEGLAFLGRMEAAKGPDLAIDAARALRRPLTLAGPVTDPSFFEEVIEPALGDGIRYAGVLDHDEKTELLGSSTCVLMPSRWPEPFGLVAVEAMACGTPVAALPSGALPEVVQEELTGAVGADLIDAVRRAERLDRTAVREHAAARFGIEAVAARYLEVLAEVAGDDSRRVTRVAG